ncbi:hypothetical protein F4780DRAFT_466816 [Xylariomycetidae sp. FL0641]|nr:hypothetical protein F4780DRAFT_466816 [Xylariomycetidae sp. FL0641]
MDGWRFGGSLRFFKLVVLALWRTWNRLWTTACDVLEPWGLRDRKDTKVPSKDNLQQHKQWLPKVDMANKGSRRVEVGNKRQAGDCAEQANERRRGTATGNRQQAALQLTARHWGTGIVKNDRRIGHWTDKTGG